MPQKSVELDPGTRSTMSTSRAVSNSSPGPRARRRPRTAARTQELRDGVVLGRAPAVEAGPVRGARDDPSLLADLEDDPERAAHGISVATAGGHGCAGGDRSPPARVVGVWVRPIAGCLRCRAVRPRRGPRGASRRTRQGRPSGRTRRPGSRRDRSGRSTGSVPSRSATANAPRLASVPLDSTPAARMIRVDAARRASKSGS